MTSLSPIVRLSVGLILLTVSLLLIGDLLGLAPNQHRAEHKARKVIAEALAVQVSADISAGRVGPVVEIVEALHERNDDVLSVALRRNDGRLVASAGDHVKHWDPSVGERSTSSHVQVPIHGETGPWGRVEVSFQKLEGLWASLFKGGSIATVILFVALTGFAAYWLFLKRALNELDPSAVVPDRVRTALDALSEGLVILDRSGRMVLINASFERILSESREALIGSTLSAMRWEDEYHVAIDNDDSLPWHRLLDSGEVPKASQLGLQTKTRQRLTFGINCSPVMAPDGRLRGVVVTFDDLTEMEHKNTELERALERLEQSQREITRQNQELHVLATRDPLTGVLNRRSLFDGMATLIRECAEAGEPISVIMVDIDHFKSINGRFGHATGDKVIKLLADILTQGVRAHDLVGRYGGEEFCIVLPGVDEAGAAEVAEKTRVVVHDGKSAKFTSAIRISASFGVADIGDADLHPGALIDLADKALYDAKESGRNRVRCWSQIASDDHVVIASPAPGDDTVGEASDDAAPQVAPRIDPTLVKENEKLRNRIGELEALLGKQIGKKFEGYDDATGLPSRVVLVDRIGQAIERCRRVSSRMALLSLDVDAIKLVRTTQGTRAADKLLRIASARLRKAVRSVDTVAVPAMEDFAVSISAMGNGEFVLLLTDMAKAESTTWVVQRIFSLFEGIIDVDGHEILLDASIGISIFPNDADSPDELLANSATALREAKLEQKRQACLYFSKTMNERSRQQLQMQSQLSLALERDELFLEYQPSVGMRDGKIVGLEALIRWRHPERGLVRPDTFIPVAEHAGLIDQIGDWVIDTAVNQLKQWNDMGCDDIAMSINFSALQFRRADLVERVIAKVKAIGVAPSSIIIEITESTLIRNLDTAVDMVTDLSEAGFRIALDDFGTGYSSLSYLQRFPIDIVKIDRSFLRDFPTQAHDTEIVSAIVAIAHNLGKRVVAEGVETERQFAVLKNLHCDEIQGFLFSKPLSRESASALLLNPSKIRRTLRAIPAHGQAEAHAPVPLDVISSESPRGFAATK